VPDWPWKGKIIFSNVTVSYGPENMALKNVSFTIQAGEKVSFIHTAHDSTFFQILSLQIAVIGRTGCGKSTLISAMARLVDTSGDILIDAVNISQVSPRKLRKRIGIIPQDPYFFDGTLRSTLDPFQEFTDEQIMEALSMTHLTNAVHSLPLQLQTEVWVIVKRYILRI